MTRKSTVVIVVVIVVIVLALAGIIVADIVLAGQEKERKDREKKQRTAEQNDRLLQMQNNQALASLVGNNTQMQMPMGMSSNMDMQANMNSGSAMMHSHDGTTHVHFSDQTMSADSSAAMMNEDGTCLHHTHDMGDDTPMVPVRDAKERAKNARHLDDISSLTTNTIGGGDVKDVFAAPDDSRLPKWRRDNIPARPQLVKEWAANWNIPDTKAMFEKSRKMPHPMLMTDIYQNIKSQSTHGQGVYGMLRNKSGKHKRTNTMQLPILQGYANDDYDEDDTTNAQQLFFGSSRQYHGGEIALNNQMF